MKRRPGSEWTGSAVTVWLAVVTGDSRAAAHRLLVRAVARTLGRPTPTVGTAREPGGRLRLTGAAAGLHVALSHTDGVAAVATSALGPVGVDVELRRELPAVDLAHRWLSPEEAARIAELPPECRSPAFLRHWTAKEAVGKARGTGLRGGVLRQPVGPLPSDGPPVLRPVPGDPAMVVATRLVDRFPLPPVVLGVACAAVEARDLPVEIRRDGPERGRSGGRPVTPG